MALDSVPVFETRLAELDLLQFRDAFESKGWTTLGKFAFAASYQVVVASEDVFQKSLVQPITNNGDGTSVHSAAVRRLFFEAYTQAASEMNMRLSRPDDDHRPRKLPGPERAARLKAIKAELIGLDIEGDLEPSDGLVDRFHDMLETGKLLWLEWELLGRFDQETQGIKKDPQFSCVGGYLRERVEYSVDRTDLSTDLNLFNALHRRGIAMQVARLVSCDVHKKIVKPLMQEYNRPPFLKHAAVALEQVRGADQEIFRRLAQESRAGLGMDQTGKPKLDALVPGILNERGVQTALQQLPLAVSSNSAANKPERKRGVDHEMERLREENARLKKTAKKDHHKGGKGKGKGKGQHSGLTVGGQSIWIK